MKRLTVLLVVFQISTAPTIAQNKVSEDIMFKSGEIELHGTLYLPYEFSEPIPAVIALHGAGLGDRDNSIFEHLITNLPPQGIAVFVYDRRGSGESGGEIQTADYMKLAKDAVAAKIELSQHRHINSNLIGFWGLSQGGWLAPLAATIAKNAAFSISVAGPGVTPSEQMLYFSINILRSEGFSDEQIDRMSTIWMDYEDFMNEVISYEEIREIIKEVNEEPWLDLIIIPDYDSIPKNPKETHWYLEYSYDPLETISNLNVPTLYIYGGNDEYVPAETSISRLREHITQEQEISWYIINQGNHVISKGKTPQNLDELNPLKIEEYHFILHAWLKNVITRK